MTLIVTATHRRRKNSPFFPRHTETYDLTISLQWMMYVTSHYIWFTERRTGPGTPKINVLLGRTYVLPIWSLTPILSPAPPAERSNESMSVENNAPPSPCSRGYHRDPASGVI